MALRLKWLLQRLQFFLQVINNIIKRTAISILTVKNTSKKKWHSKGMKIIYWICKTYLLVKNRVRSTQTTTTPFGFSEDLHLCDASNPLKYLWMKSKLKINKMTFISRYAFICMTSSAGLYIMLCIWASVCHQYSGHVLQDIKIISKTRIQQLKSIFPY